MSSEQASRVPDKRASASDDPGPRGQALKRMFRSPMLRFATLALGPGSRSARASALAPLARDTQESSLAENTQASSRSAAYVHYLKALRRRTRSIQAWQLGLVVAVLILWEVAPRANWINPMLTSYPSAV